MNLHNIFERVYTVNLARRKERWELFTQRLPSDWPFRQPERYPAIDGGLVSPPSWWHEGSGAWGCYRSHLRILEDCLNNRIDSVLIMEDDASCEAGFCEKVEHFFGNLPSDWSWIYLGGQHIQEDQGLPHRINDWVYRPFNVNRCHCYGFRGRESIEMVYRHLNDISGWTCLHHIDHYLGELHKQRLKGLYVPREWLVAQSEGESDICGAKLELRLFPSAVETVHPRLDRPGVAILGGYFGGMNTVSGILYHMGIHTAYMPENPGDIFEDAHLGEICRKCFQEPWIPEMLATPERVDFLRYWAGRQCKYLQEKKADTPFCGKHPILSLMGPELMEAWNSPRFIVVERPDQDSIRSMNKNPWRWHPEATAYTLQRLRQSRETFLSEHSPELLRLNYDQILAFPEETIRLICNFIHHVPNNQQKEATLAFLKKCAIQQLA